MTLVKNLSNRELKTFRRKMIFVFDNSTASKVKGEASIVLSMIEEEMCARGLETEEEFTDSAVALHQWLTQLKGFIKHYYVLFTKRSKVEEVRFKV